MKRILLAEDNVNDVELTLAALQDSGLAKLVEVVNDGSEALDYLFCREKYAGRTSGAPIVILLDLKMPRISGLEVLKTIRADPSLKIIPVVILTSSKEECDLVAGYNLGANAYVVKPLNFNDFTRAIRQLGGFWCQLNQPPTTGTGQ